MKTMLWWPARVLSFAVFAGTYGCGPSCSEVSSTPVTYDGGVTDAGGTYYQTSPIDGPYESFPAGRVLDVKHGLAGMPTDVQVYLSFEKDPFPSGFTTAAGDLGVVKCTDAGTVRVQNVTCEDFFVRITAEIAGEFEARAVEPLCE
jgi:hypothetical protein